MSFKNIETIGLKTDIKELNDIIEKKWSNRSLINVLDKWSST
jgi:hypothetical protein